MRGFNFFSLIIMAASVLFTWNAIADTGSSPKIHILQNLDRANFHKVIEVLKHRGYTPTTKPIFSESESTIVFTRVDANEMTPPSMQIEIIMKKDKSLPKTVFIYSSPTGNIEDALAALPPAEKLKEFQLGLNN